MIQLVITFHGGRGEHRRIRNRFSGTRKNAVVTRVFLPAVIIGCVLFLAKFSRRTANPLNVAFHRCLRNYYPKDTRNRRERISSFGHYFVSYFFVSTIK